MKKNHENQCFRGVDFGASKTVYFLGDDDIVIIRGCRYIYGKNDVVILKILMLNCAFLVR